MLESKNTLLSNRHKVIIIGIGVGTAVIGLSWLVRRFFKKSKKHANRRLPRTPEPSIQDLTMYSDSTSYRSAPSRLSSRRRLGPSVSANVPPNEAALFGGLDTCHDLMTSLNKALAGLDLVKNRSDKDRQRVELLSSVIERLRFVETDLSKILQDGGFEHVKSDENLYVSQNFPTHTRTATLSVLSDDSFMSAVETFGVSLEDDPCQDLDLNEDALLFLQEGFDAVEAGEVICRKDRSEFCQCVDKNEFLAKLFCIRLALQDICADAHRRVWLANSGRQLLGNLLKHCHQSPTSFFKAFDEIMSFVEDEENLDITAVELKQRGVSALTFWDIILDFILLDAFEDLKNPPSAIYSVTKNYWLSESMKYSTISTIIWSMLKAKRQRLQFPNGFIAHFYNISEAVSPAITLGFLGTNPTIGELCHYFKEQIAQLVVDMFNTKRVRYTSLKDLATDIWLVIETRVESILTRLSSELPL